MSKIYIDLSAMPFLNYYEAISDARQEENSKTSANEINDHRQVLCTCLYNDFIILAEFSELTGPIPLLTIPSTAQECEKHNVNINEIVTQVMSLDYQTNSSEDVQIWHLNFASVMNVYVHYTTLHDLKARGFVRPLCFSYVTYNKKKVQNSFPTLREEFLKITHLIKTNNCQIFLKEIDNSLDVIKEKQKTYFEINKKEDINLTTEDKLFLKDNKIETLISQYTDLKNLYHYIIPQIKDEVQSLNLLTYWEKKCSEYKENALMNKYIFQICNSDLSLQENIKNILFLSPWGFTCAFWHFLILLRLPYNDLLENRCLIIKEKVYNEFKPENALHDNEFLSIIEYCLTLLERNSSLTFQSFQEQTENIQALKQLKFLTSPPHEYSIYTQTNKRLLNFCFQYSDILKHLFYSILIKRTIILAGDESYEELVNETISLLKGYVPTKNISILKWHKGILLNSHVVNNEIIGLCVPERMSFHDMINPKEMNTVTILDLKKKELFGPAYCGQILEFFNNVNNFTNDESLKLYITTNLFIIKEKVYLYNALIESKPKDEDITESFLVWKHLGLKTCDISILKIFKNTYDI